MGFQWKVAVSEAGQPYDIAVIHAARVLHHSLTSARMICQQFNRQVSWEIIPNKTNPRARQDFSLLREKIPPERPFAYEVHNSDSRSRTVTPKMMSESEPHSHSSEFRESDPGTSSGFHQRQPPNSDAENLSGMKKALADLDIKGELLERVWNQNDFNLRGMKPCERFLDGGTDVSRLHQKPATI